MIEDCSAQLGKPPHNVISPLEKGGGSCPEKVAQLTIGQRFADTTAKIIRSWAFIIIQLILTALWIYINRNFPSIAWDNHSFDILRLALAVEGSFVGSVLLMNQHRVSEKDRRIVYNDYCCDIQIRQELKEMRPMIEKMYKSLPHDDHSTPETKT